MMCVVALLVCSFSLHQHRIASLRSLFISSFQDSVKEKQKGKLDLPQPEGGRGATMSEEEIIAELIGKVWQTTCVMDVGNIWEGRE